MSRQDEFHFPRPFEPCGNYSAGVPRGEPLPSGRLCGGSDGQPCPSCVRWSLGMRGQAEFFAETMGYRPKGKP